MAKIKSKVLSFPGSSSPDLAGYKLYYGVEAEPTYESISVNLSMETSIDLATLDLAEGDYYFGVTAYDAAGNESDMSMVGPVPLDFTPPDGPGSVTVS